MILAAIRGGYDFGNDFKTNGPVHETLYVIAGLVVFIAFIFAARFVAHLVGQWLHKRQVRPDMIVLGRRAATAVILLFGLFAAVGFAVQSANVTLFGLLLATIIAALGVQDLLKDYVSGYYVLLEKHVRVGDHIGIDTHTGVIVEVKLRVTMLKSDDGNLIVIPNSDLFTKPVTVYNATVEARTAPPT